MTELVLRFEHLVGRAALKLWSDLPRDCPSSDDLRPIRYFENGGSGSSGVRV